MIFPRLTELPTKRDMIDAFLGYNHNLQIAPNEMYDMKNMSSSAFPTLSPRQQRGVYATLENHPSAIIAKDTLCYVDGSNIVIDGYPVDLGLSTDEENAQKTLVSMGAYIIVLPDKKFINTADLSEFGNIEASVSTETPVSFTLCTVSGDDMDVRYVQPSAPAEPANMDYWIDTSSTPNTLKQWSETSGMWVSIATTYIKIGATGIGAAFKQYDGVVISGLKDVDLIDADSGDVLHDSKLSAIDGSYVVWACDDDYIVITGILDEVRTITNSVSVSRKMPTMDFVIESQNRLWGCRYGTSESGGVVNEIYASKLGDFKNWSCFMGLSTDSYTASVGTDGAFTGAITHLGYPLFFKETCLHKVYGNYPANYQIQTTPCRGVQSGCGASLAIVNEMLYYKSRSSVCVYDGSLPQEISEPLGDAQYGFAVGGSHGNKYYVSMLGDDNKYHLFVYDAQRGMWHKEDNTRVDAFCSCRGEMYYIDHDDNAIHTMFGSGTPDTTPVEWMVETGTIGTDSPDKKYVSQIVVRVLLNEGSTVDFYAQYDSSCEWEHMFTMHGSNLRSYAIPLRPRRCDHMRLRIVGHGDAKIYSMSKTTEEGSAY